MSLPRIPPYDLPAPDTWPGARAGWRADPRRAVLLIHDMQKYFVDAFTDGHPLLAGGIGNILAIREACDELGIPTVLSAQPPRQHPARRGLLTDVWGPGLSTDADARIIAPLSPRPGDIELVKWRYSAFARTDLLELMRRSGRDQLLITGVYAHIGCQQTAADAFMNDIEPYLIADAVADFSLADHLRCVDYVSRVCGSAVTTAEVVGNLVAAPAIPASPRPACV